MESKRFNDSLNDLDYWFGLPGLPQIVVTGEPHEDGKW